MLNILEQRLFEAVKAVQPEELPLHAGPSGGPRSGAEALVEIAATGLQIRFPEDAETLRTLRERSHLLQHVEWTADGTTHDFELPPDVAGDLTEVESPPGHALRRGDDFLLDGRTVQFFRAPIKGIIRATVRGATARGYREKRPCGATLGVSAWAPDTQRADELLAKTLYPLLAACVDLGNVQGLPNDAGVRLRLLSPFAELESIRRQRVRIGDRDFNLSAATIKVFGTLEVTVALGAAPVEGVINEIELQQTKVLRVE